MKHLKRFKNMVACIMAFAMIVCFLPGEYRFLTSAKTVPEGVLAKIRENGYSQYLEKYAEVDEPQAEILLDLSTAEADGAEISIIPDLYGKTSVLMWENQTGSVTFFVSIAQPGLYSMEMTYMPIPETNKRIELSVKIDGEIPFQEAEGFSMPLTWRDKEGSTREDKKGNQIKPSQEKADCWTVSPFNDPAGRYNQPLKFYFAAGEHRITLEAEMAGFYLSSIRLFNPTPLIFYEEYVKQYEDKPNQPEDIHFEAEDAARRSDSVLQPGSVKNDPLTSPSHPSLIRLNSIGQSWSAQNQWIEWDFEVKSSGFYKLGMRYKQNGIRGFFVTRRIYLDGKVPFREFDAVQFDYSNDWQFSYLGGEEPLLVYLTEGPHTLRMENILGEFSDVVTRIGEVTQSLNYLYRKIVMITGVNPDPYRDYFLEEQIPGLLEGFSAAADALKEQRRIIESSAGSKGSEAVYLSEVADQLNDIVKYPETIKNRLSRLNSSVSGLSSWILAVQSQNLILDRMCLVPADAPPEKAKSGFFQVLLFRIKALLDSFLTDNSVISDGDDAKALRVWINAGVDQANIIKRALDETFSPETGIPVQLQLVQGALIEAVLAGKGPDVSLIVDRSVPVNLAARGAVCELSGFDDFEQVESRFAPGALTPYQYRGGTYALPVTQSFNMLFYRVDIFREMNLNPPSTWEELSNVIAVLSGSNMMVGVGPSNSTTSVSPDIFAALLLQRGISYYNNSLTSTNFGDQRAVEAFKEWTEFFTQSGAPVTFDFYNRFRTGEMPIGIQPISNYNLLLAAAPEIRGMWEMLPIPGTKTENGIDRSSMASGTGCIILKICENQYGAWELLKWWTSAGTQEYYGRELEMLMGPAARYDTANLQAFENLPWSEKEISIINAQREWVREIPEIPASYYTSRGISNAFRDVVYNRKNYREVLYYQNKLINKEIDAKNKELE